MLKSNEHPPARLPMTESSSTFDSLEPLPVRRLRFSDDMEPVRKICCVG